MKKIFYIEAAGIDQFYKIKLQWRFLYNNLEKGTAVFAVSQFNYTTGGGYYYSHTLYTEKRATVYGLAACNYVPTNQDAVKWLDNYSDCIVKVKSSKVVK